MIQFQSFCLLHLALAIGFVIAAWLVIWYFCMRDKGRASPPLEHRWDDEVESATDEADDLMGQPVLEHGVSILSDEEFGFVDKAKQLGMVPDLQRDIQDICKVLSEKDGSKEDFLAMFGVVRQAYPWVAKSTLLAELNVFIRESVPFHISAEELEDLWN
jgi:hypothetical protein